MRKTFITLMTSLGLGLLGGYLAGSMKGPKDEATSIPIAIMDRGQLLKTLDKSIQEGERTETIRRFETAAARLSDAGYLVIDRGWVIAAPEEYYVDPD